MILGHIELFEYLSKKDGVIFGQLVQDAKERWYERKYNFNNVNDEFIDIWPENKTQNTIRLPKRIPLTAELVIFLGLYSGDGAKGSEKKDNPGKIVTSIAFSQKEPHLIKFAIEQFRSLFGESINFEFSLGEDSAHFMDNEGHEKIKSILKTKTPLVLKPLEDVRKDLKDADQAYLRETRNTGITNEDALAFHYQYYKEMQEYLINIKLAELNDVKITLNEKDKVTASLRRPFKKGARQIGGTSRSDELYVRGVTGMGELFLKILHSVEESILKNNSKSEDELIKWKSVPSEIGEILDLKDFFINNNYAVINNSRPILEEEALFIKGRYPRGAKVKLFKELRLDPLWLYAAGLYLAEGTTSKEKLFQMYTSNATGFGLSFTSSEPNSLEIIIRALSKLFYNTEIVNSWKIKVGSQYFPELVTTGLKLGVPMLRGGKSGDGKLRTMEISLSIKEWALEVIPYLIPYENKYSHVEPTGAGVARIDFTSSSTLCKWYFTLIVYSTFNYSTSNPKGDF